MCGMFESTDGEEYEINIPSPYLCDSKDKAMKARNLGYRFVMLDENIGPQIVIYENENLKVQNNNGKKDLKVWVDGKKVELYDFNKFKELGGYIRILKPECKGLAFIDGNTDFIDTDKTFTEIFPDIQKQKLYYIDNEAYYIKEY